VLLPEGRGCLNRSAHDSTRYKRWRREGS
jgi:hypothetical protein